MLDCRRAQGSVRPPLIDASTGRTCAMDEMSFKVDTLAAALYEDLGCSRGRDSAAAKVVGVVCLNTVGLRSIPSCQHFHSRNFKNYAQRTEW